MPAVRLRSIVGHPAAVRVLGRLIDRGRLPHALIIEGPPGCGRRTLARALAASLLCPERRDGDACGVCRHCAQSTAGTHPDLVELPGRREAPGGLAVEAVREVAEGAYASPLLGTGKAIILPDAERLRDQSANALLKVLEEPPPATWLLLTASTAASLLGTIRSRSQVFRLTTLAPSDAARLQPGRPAADGPPAPIEDLLAVVAASDFAAVARVVAGLPAKAGEDEDLTPAAAQRACLRTWLTALAERLRRDLRDPDPAQAGQAVDRLERVHRAVGDLERNLAPRLVLDALASGR